MKSIFDSLITLPGLDLEWQMTNCERFALTSLLERINPEMSVEIGTYRGGSLQVLARFSGRVISVDIDPGVAEKLEGKFDNVQYRSGDSKSMLPELVRELNEKKEPIAFVLIDGDHSTEGVRRDINAMLLLRPTRRVVIILHDSFNPACREGMRRAAWAESPYVHHVELDFIPGVYHAEAYDTAEARTMWGGFGCAVLEAEPRKGELTIGEKQKGLFEAVFPTSVHAPKPGPSLAQRIYRKAKRVVQGA